jgi:hypothetical protein
MHIIDYENNKEVFCFNSEGTYTTSDKKIIEFMKKNKWFIKKKRR